MVSDRDMRGYMYSRDLIYMITKMLRSVVQNFGTSGGLEALDYFSGDHLLCTAPSRALLCLSPTFFCRNSDISNHWGIQIGVQILY